jgi:hypothetical protein
MPVIQNEQTIALGVAVANTIAGSAFEFARVPSLIQIGVSAAATGMFCTIQNGSDIIAEEFAPAILTRYPIIPDEMYYSDYSAVGDRLVIKVRNPTAGAIVFRTVVQLSQVGG